MQGVTFSMQGAGVTGLTSAISLLRKGYKDVTVVSKHVPGDLSTEYTSPWAGASILTVADHDDYRLQGIVICSFYLYHITDVNATC